MTDRDNYSEGVQEWYSKVGIIDEGCVNYDESAIAMYSCSSSPHMKAKMIIVSILLLSAK